MSIERLIFIHLHEAVLFKMYEIAKHTSSDMHSPPCNLINSYALLINPLGYWTVPPTP